MTSKYGSSTSFIDFLFNLLLVFVSLFILSFLLINPNNQTKTVDPDSEFIIVMNWPEESDDDVDLWAEDPQGNIVYYNRREAGLMHLDHDDLGQRNDRVETTEGVVVSLKNQEKITLRGYIPGEYVVNVFMYNKSSDITVPVTVKVIKLNPFQMIHDGTVLLENDGEEKTVCRFYLNKAGQLIDKNAMPKSLVRGL